MTAAAIVGAGGAALAATGSGTTDGRPAASTHAGNSAGSGAHHGVGRKAHGKHNRRAHRLLRRVDHAQIVTHSKKRGFVTHQLIRGTVTDVSATSLTVTSADHTTDTFTVTKDTKVRARTDGKPQVSSIAKVSKGDHVFVGGTGASSPVARRVFDRGSK
ncbi:hypothetical protein [Jatrophihabitans endophyticus]|uniref:hypothetical protein n=1 Tax=Jatrophihabitans endophyticus TaxID=1206085 RepID=UPI001A0BFA1E|nr:hypothetical protein [Jatrophihabitans endophyticus]MBE7189135.1 hypothetical protein [Jatrophihabitans endophyticus]